MKMYERETRRIESDSVRDDLKRLLREKAESHDLGDILEEATDCFETISRILKKPGFFERWNGVDEENRSYFLLHPRYLIITAMGDRSRPFVSVFEYAQIDVSDFKSDLVDDRGLEIVGYSLGTTGITSGHGRPLYFVGLGEEPAADEFKNRLLELMNRNHVLRGN